MNVEYKITPDFPNCTHYAYYYFSIEIYNYPSS